MPELNCRTAGRFGLICQYVTQVSHQQLKAELHAHRLRAGATIRPHGTCRVPPMHGTVRRMGHSAGASGFAVAPLEGLNRNGVVSALIQACSCMLTIRRRTYSQTRRESTGASLVLCKATFNKPTRAMPQQMWIMWHQGCWDEGCSIG